MIERATERALVTDFGIALGKGEGESRGGVVIGTARYMSPEQACGEPVDARSDLYSLGATFFYALTGHAPFEGKTLAAILAKQVAEPAPLVQAVRPEVPAKLAAVIDRCLEKLPAKRFQSGDDVARVVGEVRGRDFRAPPIVRAFTRNAQVSTMVLFAMMLAGQSVTIAKTGVTVSMGGPGVIGIILLCQLMFVARRLLKDGYAFSDIRAALLAEAQVQAEEAEVIKQRRWLRRLDTLWYKLWAGRVGRAFFKVAGWRLKAPARLATASVERTELVLERSALAAYNALPRAERREMSDVPGMLDRLEAGAEALRAKGDTGERLTAAVAALEHLRLALVRLQAGDGSVGDVTHALERAREIGEHVDARLEAAREVESLLE
jgi:serine/threonine-protein kinase